MDIIGGLKELAMGIARYILIFSSIFIACFVIFYVIGMIMVRYNHGIYVMSSAINDSLFIASSFTVACVVVDIISRKLYGSPSRPRRR